MVPDNSLIAGAMHLRNISSIRCSDLQPMESSCAGDDSVSGLNRSRYRGENWWLTQCLQVGRRVV
jgi:hypothetical protein